MESNEVIGAGDLASLRPYAAIICASQFTTEQLAFFSDHWSQPASPGTRHVALQGYASCTDYWRDWSGRIGEHVVRNTLAEALTYCGWTVQSIEVVVTARLAGQPSPKFIDCGWTVQAKLATPATQTSGVASPKPLGLPVRGPDRAKNYFKFVFVLLALWMVGGAGFAFAAAMQIVTEGLDETSGMWIILLFVYVLSWVIILKSKKVNDWVRRQD
jgi:hypothetical protein